MKNKDVIPVFFTVDDKYAPYLAVAVNSLIHNASGDYFYKIIVIYEHLSEENKRKIKLLETDYAAIEFGEMKQSLSCITDKPGNHLRADYFTLTIFFRLFLADMFPEYDKAVYLDSDIVVPGDISEFYKYELGDNLVGAIKDNSVVDVDELGTYMEEAVGVDRHLYVNSGILLLNMKKLREVGFAQHFLHLLTEYHFDCVAPDQDYLNAMCFGKICFLPECWDAMPTEGVPPMENPKIIHYNLWAKPWLYDNIAYEEYFWKYAKDSGYLSVLKEIKETYTDKERADDSMHAKLMIKRAVEISGMENTMKNIFEKGTEKRI